MLPHLLARFSGTLYGGPQTWSCGFRFRSATGGDPGGIAGVEEKLETWRDAIRALNAGKVFPQYLLALMGGPTRLTAIRCSAVGTDGKETAVALVEGAPLSIGTRAAVMPQQVSCAFSLDTGRPGATNRGRVYWPAIGAGIDASGHQAAADTGQYATDMAGFIADLNNAGASLITPGLAASVVSTVRNTAYPITQVRVGNRLDIQRRRADKQDESYSVAVIAD